MLSFRKTEKDESSVLEMIMSMNLMIEVTRSFNNWRPSIG